jgi:hypothetical protein
VSTPTVDILVRSCSRDFPWLHHCLAAIRRRCRGFRDVILVVPERSAPRLARWDLPADRVEVCRDFPDDYLGQQVTKLHADLLTDADLIAHLDSDCVVRRPLRPSDLCDPAGRPRIAITPLSSFGGRGPWQEATERFLGWPVAFDYMRRQPLIFPRWLYAELRRHAEAAHGVVLEDYVLARGPMDFSEFNALGALAHRRHPERFAWEIGPSASYDETYARAFWSWEGITPASERELRALAGEAAGAA